MLWPRHCLSLVIALILAGSVQAQTCLLKEAPLQGSHHQVKILTTITGELRIPQQKEPLRLKQAVAGEHEFVERVLEADEHNLGLRSARHYRKGQATITLGSDRLERTFRPERTLIVAQRYNNVHLCFCPRGSFTREELELTQHFTTLVLPGLLPGKEVKVGETWKPDNAVAQILCQFDGLTTQDFTCKLEEIKNGRARISLSGKAGGIDQGASVQLEVQASYEFDVQAQRIVSLEWTQKDERDQGPVNPAVKMEVAVKMTRMPVESAAEVSDFALVPVPTEKTPPESMLALHYADPKQRYEMTLAREWVTVARTRDHLVLRLMDRGEFVAQATISCWPRAKAGEHASPDTFKTAMSEAPGWVQHKQIEAREIEGARGYWIYRIEAEGELHGLKTLQYFHLIAGPEGDQVVVAVTLTPAQVQKLGTRDLALVRSVVFPMSNRNEAVKEP